MKKHKRKEYVAWLEHSNELWFSRFNLALALINDKLGEDVASKFVGETLGLDAIIEETFKDFDKILEELKEET